MKRTITHLLTFIILVVFLFPSSGYSPGVSANGGTVTLSKMKGPPAKMCVGESTMVTIGVSYLSPGKTHVSAEASGGTLTSMNWTFQRGADTPILFTTFKATESGDGTITFSSQEGGASPVVYPVKIVDCFLKIQISTTETVHGDPASFQITIEGTGDISVFDNTVNGIGTYNVSINIHYKTKTEGVFCYSKSPVQGEGNCGVTGSQSGNLLLISLTFAPAQVSGSDFECQDENGRTASVPSVIQGSTDTQSYLPLTGLTITPGVLHPFTCGSQGRGSLYVIPRSDQ